MILVTGAGGKTGRVITESLRARGADVRALVRRREQAQVVRALGAAEVVVGDMRDADTMNSAMRGARGVYHICPNMHPDEIAIGQLALDAACRAGARHYVYHSVLHPQTEDMPHHWNKRRVEELLFESGLPFTILQPAAYMQNILAHRRQIIEEAVYPVPYAAETRLSLVDLRDVAEVAATVLTEPGHPGATYELVGSHPLTQIEVAVVLTEQLRRTVQVKAISREKWAEQARESGLDGYQIETATRMFEYYQANGFAGNANVLTWLLGRAPTSLAEFMQRELIPRT